LLSFRPWKHLQGWYREQNRESNKHSGGGLLLIHDTPVSSSNRQTHPELRNLVATKLPPIRLLHSAVFLSLQSFPDILPLAQKAQTDEYYPTEDCSKATFPKLHSISLYRIPMESSSESAINPCVPVF